MNASTQLNLQRIVQHDPLARRLSRQLEPIRFVIAGLFLGITQTLALPVFAGVLESGSLVDWQNLVIMLVLVPLILGWYAWQPRAILNLYQTLLERIPPQQQGTANPYIILNASYKYPSLTWLVLAISVGATIALALRLSAAGSASWENATIPLFAMRLGIRFITFYTLLMFLTRQIIATVVINRFFRKLRVNLNPLHPDESGGLRVLGKYALNSAGLVMVVGLLLSLQYIAARWGNTPLGPEFPFVVLFYLIAGPAVFFLPLLQSHRQMNAARNKLLVEIAEEFEILHREIQNRFSQNKELANALIQFEAIEDLHAVVSASPAWPFNITMLSRFGGLIALPILVPIVAEILAVLFIK